MNTTSLTAGRSAPGQAAVVRVGAQRVRRRVSVRVGLALVAWGRRADARRLPETVAQRRERRFVADELLEQGFSTVALLTRPSL